MTHPPTIWDSDRRPTGLAGRTLHGVVLHAASVVEPGTVALVDGGSGHTVTYAELAGQVWRTAASLASMGIGRGDVVLLDAPSSPEWFVALLGAQAVGAVVSTVDPHSRVEDMAAQLRDCRPRLVLTTGSAADTVIRAMGVAGTAPEVLYLGAEEPNVLPPSPAPVAAIPALADDPSAPATLLYSSGTTGRPKGVVTSHAAFTAVADQMQALPGLAPGATFVVPAPMYAAGGLWSTVGAVAAGATAVILPSSDLERFCRVVQTYRATHAVVTPPMVLGLSRHPAVDRYDLSSLRCVGSAGAPLGAGLQAQVAERLGCPVGQAYGMTETGPVAVSDVERIRPGGAGRLTAGTSAMVVDPDTGDALGVGEVGELWVRTPSAMTGYLGRAEETRNVIATEGWLRTGDLVHIDRDGEIYVVDRLEELIRTNGFQVAPAELEELLVSIDGVLDAAVVARPHPTAGEVPVAYAVLADSVDPAAVLAELAGRTASYKRITELVRVEQVPKSSTGKILRRELIERERLAGV